MLRITMIYQRLAKVFLICSSRKKMIADRKIAKQFTNAGDIQSGVATRLGGSIRVSTKQGNGMRGIVAFAIMTAILAVIDAAFFKGKYLQGFAGGDHGPCIDFNADRTPLGPCDQPTSHRRQELVAAVIGVEFTAALPLDRGAARGRRGILGNAEGTAEAVGALPALPAAKAALVALMQTTKSAAAAISIINFMARFSSRGYRGILHVQTR